MLGEQLVDLPRVWSLHPRTSRRLAVVEEVARVRRRPPPLDLVEPLGGKLSAVLERRLDDCVDVGLQDWELSRGWVEVAVVEGHDENVHDGRRLSPPKPIKFGEGDTLELSLEGRGDARLVAEGIEDAHDGVCGMAADADVGHAGDGLIADEATALRAPSTHIPSARAQPHRIADGQLIAGSLGCVVWLNTIAKYC